jgi:hypothetical protein
MRTVPVNHSAGPLPDGCEPARLISMALSCGLFRDQPKARQTGKYAVTANCMRAAMPAHAAAIPLNIACHFM